MRWITVWVIVFLLMVAGLPVEAQSEKPFGLPMATAASPSTWLMGQPYGNTIGAYNFGTQWYSAGQGLHFGIDVSMPCGTPLVAVADGDVIYVDNLAFGAGPHNLIIRHSQANVTTLYGHLLDRAPLQQYQPVTKGQLVGYSGDPDETCDSRPHLHFEVRSLDYRTAYNPIDYIDAPWHVLAAIGPFNQPLFQQDMTNPRRWMSLDDQPSTAFGGARLNNYAQTWPLPQEQRPPGGAPPYRLLSTPPAVSWQMRPLTYENCCAIHWWSKTDPNKLYALDGSTPNQLGGVFEWDITSGGMTGVLLAPPPPILSPDGSHQVLASGGLVAVRRLADSAEWTVQTGGFTPTINVDNTRLLWQAQYGRAVPGGTPPPVEIWVSNIDGSNPRQLLAQPRISASWLDANRLLISSSERTVTTLAVYNLGDDSQFVLGSWDRLRGLSLAPGGGHILFYQNFQADPAANAINLLATQAGAQPQRLSWFGAWRWRDAESLYYIPFEPQSPVQQLAYYHLITGENRLLTSSLSQPFTAANGDWSASPDGARLVFQNVADRRLWIIEPGAE